MERKHLILLIIWAWLLPCAHGQNVLPYKTQTIDGVEYYIYPVKQSEGLYRISVNFGVTQEEIVRLNPEVKDGLRAGQLLFIPKKTPQAQPIPPSTHDQTHTPPPVDLIAASLAGSHATPPPAAPQPTASTPQPDNEPNFYYHKVLPKQTLYSLSKQYGVRQDDIIRYNPQAATGLRAGEVLRIPKPEDIYQDRKAAKQQEDLSVKYLIHRVQPKETLYAISKQYAVEMNDILRLNPGLEVLTIGQELKIPYYAALMATDTVDGQERTFVDWNKLTARKPATGSHLRIAFLLPFTSDKPNDANITRFVDFYGGAIKALQEAKSLGVSVDVYTYDTGKTPEQMRELLASEPLLKRMDLIVGPAYTAQVPLATAFAREHRVRTLIPFTARVDDIGENPYLFQFNPGAEAETEFWKYLFATRLDGMNYIFAGLQYVPDTDEGAVLSKQIKALLDEQGKKYHTLSIADPSVNWFDSAAVYSKRNLVIFNTDQFQVAQPYFENLNLTDRRYDVLLLEQFSWKNQPSFRPVGINVSAFRMEADIVGLEEYDKAFARLLGWAPLSRNPRYDLLGYDLLAYFVRLLTTGGTDLDQALELDMYLEGLQSQFRFKRATTGAGFVNQQVYLGDSQVN